jgi:N-methylhydantoinase A/oxoprolinase/acetone carboxylase beta subunit
MVHGTTAGTNAVLERRGAFSLVRMALGALLETESTATRKSQVVRGRKV